MMPSLREVDSMTEQQRAVLLKQSTAALVTDPKDWQARAVFTLLNDAAVCSWLAWDTGATTRP